MTKEELRRELKMATLDELRYMLGRYCGPYNVILREKNFGSILSKDLQRMINDEIAYRLIDDLILGNDDNQ